jgi:protein TonB
MAVRSTTELEREPFRQPIGGPLGGSVLLHAAIAAALVVAAFIASHIHGTQWGNNQAPGAITATLVSAPPSIPLPQDTPPTPNVLATETPSPSPAPPQPKEVPVPPPDAIPIAKKEPPPPKKEPAKREQPSPKHAQPQPIEHRAQYGEAPAAAIPRSMAPQQQPQQPNSPVNAGGGQGFDYPYYVGIIQNKVRQAWYTQEVDPRTPGGSQTKITFVIARDGSASNIRISQSSGSPTLDSSAIRAAQRVENFSPLPRGYAGSSLSVEYTFTYAQPSR